MPDTDTQRSLLRRLACRSLVTIGASVTQIPCRHGPQQSPPQMPDIRLQALPQQPNYRSASCTCGGVHIGRLGRQPLDDCGHAGAVAQMSVRWDTCGSWAESGAGIRCCVPHSSAQWRPPTQRRHKCRQNSATRVEFQYPYARSCFFALGNGAYEGLASRYLQQTAMKMVV